MNRTDTEHLLVGAILAGYPLHRLPAVSPDDIHDPAARITWQAILTLDQASTKPTVETVRDQLGTDTNRLPNGPLSLIEWSQQAAPVNAPAYAQRVIDTAELDNLWRIGTRIQQLAEQPDGDPAIILENARAALDNRPSRNRKDTTTLADFYPQLVDDFQHGKRRGLPIPWPDLDRVMHGLHPGRLYVIGARPGVGKSVMCQTLATHMSDTHSKDVYYASLEMPDTEVGLRMVSAGAGIYQSRLSTGGLTDADWDAISTYEATAQQSRVHICDDPSQTVNTIRTGARDLARHGNLGLIVVDYLQLLTPADRTAPREQQVSHMARTLKKIALELDVPVIAAAQLNRQSVGRDTQPKLSDLRESGAIEQDADVVLLLHHNDPEQPWDLQVQVAKNRSGSQYTTRLLFDGARARIQEGAA